MSGVICPYSCGRIHLTRRRLLRPGGASSPSSRARRHGDPPAARTRVPQRSRRTDRPARRRSTAPAMHQRAGRVVDVAPAPRPTSGGNPAAGTSGCTADGRDGSRERFVPDRSHQLQSLSFPTRSWSASSGRFGGSASITSSSSTQPGSSACSRVRRLLHAVENASRAREGCASLTAGPAPSGWPHHGDTASGRASSPLRPRRCLVVGRRLSAHLSRAASTAERAHIVVHADRWGLVSSDRLSSAPRVASDDHAGDGAPDVALTVPTPNAAQIDFALATAPGRFSIVVPPAAIWFTPYHTRCVRLVAGGRPSVLHFASEGTTVALAETR